MEITRKILSTEALARVRDELGATGRKLVFTNGCFDILHVGHVRYLQQARLLGDALAVGLNADASVRELKGSGRPVNPEMDRAEVLAALGCVDWVTIFSEPTVAEVVRTVRPHIYCKGGDYKIETLNAQEVAELRKAGAEIRILPLVAGKSTTAILDRMSWRDQPRPLRLGVLGSGKGSNFAAIADAIAAGRVDAEVRVVISDAENAGILDLARGHGIRAEHLPPGRYKTRLEPDIEGRIVRILKEEEVDLVVLAGFMRMIKRPLLDAFPGRIINIHPALLPKFPGLEAWKQALDAGENKTGCTVHYVDAGMDSGEIIAQAEVPVLPGDTAGTLHARIQEAEHRLFPEVIAAFAKQHREKSGNKG